MHDDSCCRLRFGGKLVKSNFGAIQRFKIQKFNQFSREITMVKDRFVILVSEVKESSRTN